MRRIERQSQWGPRSKVEGTGYCTYEDNHRCRILDAGYGLESEQLVWKEFRMSQVP